MKKFFRYHISWLLLVAATMLAVNATRAGVAITVATGGTNLSADKAANAASPAYTTIGPIKVLTCEDNDFPKKAYDATITFTAPAGWEFKPNTGTGSVGGNEITFNSMTVTSSTILFSYDRHNHSSHSAYIQISGIQVRSRAGGTLPNSGNILKTASTQTIVGFPNGTSVGSLSQVVGAPAQLAINVQPSTDIFAPAAFTIQPKVVINDQFGTQTASSAVVTASDNGSATLLGTASVQAVNGVAQFTDLAYASGGTYSIRFALGGVVLATSAPFTVPVPLPVELTSFTASSRSGGVMLNWVTATEINNAGFEIQRRSASTAWTKIGYVDGNGSSNMQHEYSFKDAAVGGGTCIYRLKQIDRDGAFEYSKELEATVAMRAEDYVITQNYPNPFNPTTSIRFAVPRTQNASLTIFNVIGQEVAELFNGIAEAGVMYSVQFDATGLASGTYIYQLHTPERTEVKRMLLVR